MVMREGDHHHHRCHSGGAALSSIALLRKRFRQLQKMKELRQGKQLLRSLMLSGSEGSSYIIDPRPHNHEHQRMMSCKGKTFSGNISSESEPMMSVNPPRPQQYRELSLSLWPDTNIDSQNKNGKRAPANIKLQAFHQSDNIDTSLRL